MPEYLTPGVYVEETSFRSRSIEGVPTSTFGMAGRTEYGPVPYIIPAAPNQPQVVMTPRPTLVTSFTEFERAYGGVGDSGNPNYLAYAARAFFDNGGRRLYVSRVFDFTRGPAVPPATEGPITVDENIAKLVLGGGGGGGGAAPATWRARWPGLAGASISVLTVFRRSKNVVVGGRLRGVYPGAAIEVVAGGANQPAPKDTDPPTNLGIVARIGTGADLGYLKNNQTVVAPGAADAGYHVTVDVTVRMGDRIDTYAGLELSAVHPRSVANVLQASRPVDDLSLVWLDMADPQPEAWLPVLTALAKAPNPKSPPQADFLTGGGDGVDAGPDVLLGEKADPDDPDKAATGLEALGEIDDIAIVALPDTVRFADAGRPGPGGGQPDRALRGEPRTASPSSTRPRTSSISQVRDFRGRFDTTYARAVLPVGRDPRPDGENDPGAPPPKLQLPPSGFVAGIYARSDIERGVHKAPANEVVHGLTKFEPEHHQRPAGGAQPGGHQRPALLRGPRQPGVGRAHDALRPGVEVRQRAPAVHLPRALDRQGHPVGGVRAEQRTAVGDHPPDRRGLPAGAVAQRGADGRPSPRRRTSSAATARR